jgi:hypothetical protein
MPTAPPTPLDQREAELFAGREAELALFEERFDPPPARDERRVLLFTGVGGLGKSALARAIVRKLQANHAERPAAWALIDFADAGATDPVQACLQIRLQLGTALGGARFPIFDVAFARYHQERYPGSDVRRQFAALDPGGAIVRNLARVLPEPARDSSFWQDAADGIGELVGSLPLAGLAYKHLSEWVHRGEDWWDRRAQPLIGQLDQLGADQIAAHLPRCLGADLADAIEGMAHRLPIAVIGDTAEAFHRGQGFQSGIGAFHNDAWLRELIWHSPGVLFVLLDRDPLEWHEHEHSRLRDWQRIVETRPVSPLGDADARRVVDRFPVPEPAIRERMVAGAAGLPFYLGLQLDLYQAYVDAGQPPPADAFGVAPDAIVTRFLSHVDQRVERSLVTLAHARRFDQKLYRWLRKEHPELASDTGFPELIRFSFVEVDEGATWRLHQLMQDILQARVAKDDAAERQAIHEALFDHWKTRCQPERVETVSREHERALDEAVYYAAAAGSDGYTQKLFDLCQALQLVSRAKNVRGTWDKYNHIIIGQYLEKAAILFNDNKDEEAFHSLRSALAKCEGWLGPDHAVAVELRNALKRAESDT